MLGGSAEVVVFEMGLELVVVFYVDVVYESRQWVDDRLLFAWRECHCSHLL